MGELNTIQKQIVEHEGSCAVLGVPGTGKTKALVEKIAHLIKQGVPASDIYVVAFTYYSWQILFGKLKEKLGEKANDLNIGTFRIFAQNQIEKDSKHEFVFATDKQSRRAIRQAMREVDFKGSAVEAEHIIRKFKSMAKKPQETAEHYSLLVAYKQFCEIDRYDVLRKHIIGMRQGEYKQVPMKYVFIDNFQDITHIQFLWLMEHIKAGTIANVFGDDDLCAFKRDGSLGSVAFNDLQETAQIKTFTLDHCYRLSQDLGLASQSIVRGLKGHIHKDITYDKDKKMQVTFEGYNSADEELAILAQKIKAVDSSKTVGVITRTDWDALRVQRLFEKQGIEHSSFAHKVWEIPGAIMVLDLLCLLLNQATDVHLRNVLMGYGLNQTLIEALFKGGLHARDWLTTGAPLPKDVQIPAGALADFGAVQRQLLGYYTLLKNKSMSPQDVFKSAAFDMVERMNKEDKANALVAVETLINLKGSLREVLPQIREGKEPNIHDRIIVGPIRDMRNLEFDYVFMPLAHDKEYPYSGYTVLPVDESHDKRLFYMALTRSSEVVALSWYGQSSHYVKAIQKALNKS